MLKNIFSITLSIFISLSSFSQISFQKTYGGSGIDNATSVRQTLDGGYIVVGSTTSFGSGGRDILAVRTNSTGDTLWTKTFGGAFDNEYGFCVQQTSDLGFIISGVASSFFDASGDIYIIKLSEQGNTLWTRTYGGNGYEWGSYIEQTSDDGYIIVGQTPAFGAGGFDAYLVKLNSDGSIAWTKTYGGSGLEIGSAVQQTSDGGFILTGQIDTYGAGGGDIYLLKTFDNGEVTWAKTIGRSGTETGTAVKQTADGGYIIGATSENELGPLGPDMCLIKTNSLGDTLWAKTYGGSMIDECYDVIITDDGGYVMCGKSFSFSADGDYDIYVVKVNDDGELIWSKTYGASGQNMNDIGLSIRQTADGGFIIAGESMFSLGVGISNMYVIKTDADGNAFCYEGTAATVAQDLMPVVTNPPTIVSTGGEMFIPETIDGAGVITTYLCGTGVEEEVREEAKNDIHFFPNPFEASCTIQLPNNIEVNAICIYNLVGQQQWVLQNPKQIAGNLQLSELGTLPNGTYIAQIKTNKGNIQQKLIKQ